jgi:hypothetical protein
VLILIISAPTMAAAYHNACHDRKSSPTSGSSYHLADDRHDVEAPQGWDQELENL